MVSQNKACYLCKSNNFKKLTLHARDLKSIFPIECIKCKLVTLSSFSHIKKNHYEKSGIHGKNKLPIQKWIKNANIDDSRRVKNLNKYIKGKSILDFGCGAGGFLKIAKKIAKDISGIEPEERIQQFWKGKINIKGNLTDFNKKFDLITCFHVVEHLDDPISIIHNLKKYLKKNGVLIIEVPNHDDALISTYKAKEFIESYYWSQHLYVFNDRTLKKIIAKAGFKNICIEQVQRYTLSNHLHWLSEGLPNGHNKWSFLNDCKMDEVYAKKLSVLKKCDTIMAICK